MDTKNWLQYHVTGNDEGDGSVSFGSIAPHTGREERSMTGTVDGAGGTTCPFTVTQESPGAIFDAGSTFDPEASEEVRNNVYIGQEGGIAFIFGISNYKQIRAVLEQSPIFQIAEIAYSTDDVPDFVNPITWIPVSGSLGQWMDIPGDAGLSKMILFQIKVIVQPNPGTIEQSTELRVYGSNNIPEQLNQLKVITIIQSGDSESLSISPDMVQLEDSTDPEIMQVTSNMPWNVHWDEE